jgi:hypothetical protein
MWRQCSPDNRLELTDAAKAPPANAATNPAAKIRLKFQLRSQRPNDMNPPQRDYEPDSGTEVIHSLP